jgi:hypothetical protein
VAQAVAPGLVGVESDLVIARFALGCGVHHIFDALRPSLLLASTEATSMVLFLVCSSPTRANPAAYMSAGFLVTRASQVMSRPTDSPMPAIPYLPPAQRPAIRTHKQLPKNISTSPFRNTGPSRPLPDTRTFESRPADASPRNSDSPNLFSAAY